MALTDHCDLYGAVLESGINRVARHVMRQRPSLFNYATDNVAERPDVLCRRIDAHPVVIQRGNPLVGAAPRLPVLGTNGVYTLDYCLQFTTAEIDFSPGSVVTLPPQLSPPLDPQRFALHGELCAGLGCPPEEILSSLPVGRREGEVVIPSRRLTCACLELFLVGGADFTGPVGDQRLTGTLEGLELVDLAPEGLENAIECYASLVIQLGLLPRLAVRTIRFAKELMGIVALTIEPTPTSAALPNNPAIEGDQLKIFLDLTAVPTEPAPGEEGGGGGGGGGGSSPPPPPGVVRPRTRTGPFDAEAAISEKAVQELFAALRDGFVFSKADSGNFGPFTLSYDVEAHLEGGSIDLRDDNSIRLEELDVKWDTLEVCLGLDIPEICVGGFCLIPNPFGGCLVRVPEICVFSATPDISFCLDIGGFITSEVSATVKPVTKYAVDPARTPVMNDWDAKDAGIPNHWQLLIDPVTIDLDLFDVADTVGDLLDAAIDAAVDGLLGPLPGWAKDLIKAILGPIVDVVRFLLDLGDDIGEWISDKLGVSLGLFNFLLTAIADYFAKKRPLAQIEDPFPILPADGILIPVLIPVEFLGVSVNTDEMLLQADIGA